MTNRNERVTFLDQAIIDNTPPEKQRLPWVMMTVMTFIFILAAFMG